jgi:pyridoxal phosphate enzyme (YggS family)
MSCKMTSISENITQLKEQVPQGVKLIAVSKTKPVEQLLEAYHAGQRAFGENYVQEIIEKQPQLPGDIEWHFIGHLQSNKVKYIAPFVHWIHGIDSMRLLSEINKQAAKHNRVINCLLQVHIAQEESKFGFDTETLSMSLSQFRPEEYMHIRLCGLMGMASFTEDTQQVTKEFQLLKTTFDALKQGTMKDIETFHEISMGMSGDWPLAVKEGSTTIRVGSAIFGSRN